MIFITFVVLLAGFVHCENCKCPDDCYQEHCPTDGNWMVYDNRYNLTFHHSCYNFADTATFTHQEATSYCAGLKSQMLTIVTAQQDRLIQSVANQLFKPPTNLNASFWTGGVRQPDADGSDHWAWSADNRRMGYTNWAPDQLSDPKSDECLALAGSDDFRWHARPCAERHHVICEIRLKPEPMARNRK